MRRSEGAPTGNSLAFRPQVATKFPIGCAEGAFSKQLGGSGGSREATSGQFPRPELAPTVLSLMHFVGVRRLGEADRRLPASEAGRILGSWTSAPSSSSPAPPPPVFPYPTTSSRAS